MHLFDFAALIEKSSADEREQFIAELLSLMADGQNRAACRRFVQTVPLEPVGLFNEDYYRAEADYNLALLLASLGRTREAAGYMERSGVLSAGDWENLPFPQHQLMAKAGFEQQLEAAARGRPAVLLTSLPKSASAYLSQTIAAILDVPQRRVSMGRFPNATVVPRWAQTFASGGGVTHEHFDGSPQNLDPLIAAGFRHFFVQVRDPRAALWSNVHYASKIESDRPQSIDQMIETFYRPAVTWLSSWIAAAQRHLGQIAIYFLDFDLVASRPDAIIADILRTAGLADADRIVTAYFSAQPDAKTVNFRSGQTEEWRLHLTSEQSELLWSEIPQIIKDVININP